jgi:hypothetical protein
MPSPRLRGPRYSSALTQAQDLALFSGSGILDAFGSEAAAKVAWEAHKDDACLRGPGDRPWGYWRWTAGTLYDLGRCCPISEPKRWSEWLEPRADWDELDHAHHVYALRVQWLSASDLLSEAERVELGIGGEP